MKAWVVLALLVVAGVLLLSRGGGLDAVLRPRHRRARLIAVGVLLADRLSTSSACSTTSARGHCRPYATFSTGWPSGALSVAGYCYREEFDGRRHASVANFCPRAVVCAERGEEGERAVRVRRRLDGHFACGRRQRPIHDAAGRHRRLDGRAEAGGARASGHRRRAGSPTRVPVRQPTAPPTPPPSASSAAIGPLVVRQRRSARGQARQH